MTADELSACVGMACARCTRMQCTAPARGLKLVNRRTGFGKFSVMTEWMCSACRTATRGGYRVVKPKPVKW